MIKHLKERPILVHFQKYWTADSDSKETQSSAINGTASENAAVKVVNCLCPVQDYLSLKTVFTLMLCEDCRQTSRRRKFLFANKIHIHNIGRDQTFKKIRWYKKNGKKTLTKAREIFWTQLLLLVVQKTYL